MCALRTAEVDVKGTLQGGATRQFLCRFLDVGGINPFRTLGRPASKNLHRARSRGEPGSGLGASAMGISS